MSCPTELAPSRPSARHRARRAGTALALCALLASCDGSLGSHGPGPARDAGRDATAGDDAGSPRDSGARTDAQAERDATSPGEDSGTGVDAGPDDWFTLDDSMRGETTGSLVGGSIGPDGWTVLDRTDRIWFALPRLVEGAIEFTVTGVSIDNLLVNDNELFALYEAGHGMQEPIGYDPEIRENHYKCILRVYGQPEADRVGAQKLMWGMCPSGAPGFGACGCASFFEEPFGGDTGWDGTPQRLRVEWGGGHTRLLRDDVEAVAIDWSASGLAYGPDTLHFSFGTPRAGAVDTAGLPVGAVFSDLHAEGWQGQVATCP